MNKLFVALFFGLLLPPLSWGRLSYEEMKHALPNEYEILGEQTFQHLFRILELSNSRTDSPQACQGRLTLTTATPITTGDVTAATTVYFTPASGNKISLYSGSRWQLLAFTQVSVAVPSTTTTPFDVFAYNNSGTLTLETTDWTNDTTRATALTTQNGVSVKSGSTTRRYLGTLRTTGVSGQTEDSVQKRFLWNECNRVPRKLLAQSSTDSWTYTSASWRSANNTTTTGVTRVEFLVGRATDLMELEVYVP